MQCVLDDIMHSACMQAFRNQLSLVNNLHRVPVYTRQDPAHNRCLNSRDRSRRT